MVSCINVLEVVIPVLPVGVPLLRRNVESRCGTHETGLHNAPGWSEREKLVNTMTLTAEELDPVYSPDPASANKGLHWVLMIEVNPV